MRSEKEFNNKSKKQTLGELIKERRVELGISLEKIAFVVGVRKETLRTIEIGQVKSPGVDKIVRIFDVLGLNIEKLNEIFLSEIGKIDKKKLEELGKLTYLEKKYLLADLNK